MIHPIGYVPPKAMIHWLKLRLVIFSLYKSPFPQPSRKLLQRTLLTPSKARKPLAQVAILYSPKPKSSLKNLKVRENVDMKGRVKLKSYPDLSKERIEDRIAKRMKKRAAVLVNDPMSSSNIIKSVRKTTKKPESKHSRTKRKSKKRRLHERESKVAQIS